MLLAGEKVNFLLLTGISNTDIFLIKNKVVFVIIATFIISFFLETYETTIRIKENKLKINIPLKNY